LKTFDSDMAIDEIKDKSKEHIMAFLRWVLVKLGESTQSAR